MSIQLHETRIGMETLEAIRRFCISSNKKRIIKSVHRNDLEKFSMEHDIISFQPDPLDLEWFIVLYREG